MRPNILFILADQHRPDWLCEETPGLRTPEIDRLAREGTRFTSAICPSPLCAPSRACLATARSYDNQPVRSNADSLPVGTPTFYGGLRDSGYQVLTCGKLDLLKPAQSWGAEGLHRRPDGSAALYDIGFTGGRDSAGKHDAALALARGIDEPFGAFLKAHGLDRLHQDDLAARPSPNYRNTAPSPLPDFAYGDNWIGAQALQLMTGALGASDPWFLQVNFQGPHEPMDITRLMTDAAPWASGMDDGAEDGPNDGARKIRSCYGAMIENIDRWVGTFRAVLEDAGALENTLIVYSSDHGEMLGDRGLWAKLHPFQPSLGIPMIFRGPGVTEGQCRGDAVSLIDLGPTFTQLAGAATPPGADGQSLVPALRGQDSDGVLRVAGFGTWRAITDGRMKLIVGYDSARIGGPSAPHPFEGAALEAPESHLLYDLQEDPGETRDLAAAMPETAARLGAALGRAMAA